jgi:hypothetical protein
MGITKEKNDARYVENEMCEHFVSFFTMPYEFLCLISVSSKYTMSVLGRFYVTQLHFGEVWHPT